jgi:hypothetical protein
MITRKMVILKLEKFLQNEPIVIAGDRFINPFVNVFITNCLSKFKNVFDLATTLVRNFVLIIFLENLR